MTRITEFWKDKFGDVFKITHNPCNCHPLAVMEERDIDKRYARNFRFKRAVSYSIKSRSAFTSRLFKSGNTRLSRKVVKL